MASSSVLPPLQMHAPGSPCADRTRSPYETDIVIPAVHSCPPTTVSAFGFPSTSRRSLTSRGTEERQTAGSALPTVTAFKPLQGVNALGVVNSPIMTG